MSKLITLQNILARVEALIEAAANRTMKTAELKAAAAELNANKDIPYDATHGLYGIISRHRTYDKIKFGFTYSRTMLLNAIEKETEMEAVDQLRDEYATLPEAKRFVKQHGADAYFDWQHHRAILADAASDVYRWAICDNCEGSGKTGHPAFSNGITSSEWADMDQDGRDSYMRGDYDVQCDCCKGSGKVKLPEVSRMSWPLKRELVRQRQHNRIMAQLAREEAAERRMGA